MSYSDDFLRSLGADGDGNESDKGGGAGNGSAPDTDTKAVLERLAAGDGDEARLARELLVAHAERQAREELQDAAAREEAAARAVGIGDLQDKLDALRYDQTADPARVRELQVRLDAAKDALREAVRVSNERADALVLKGFEATLRAQGYSEHYIASELVEEAARIKSAAEMVGFPGEHDLLEDHPVWRSYQQERREKDQARALLHEMSIEAPGWDLSALQAEHDASLAEMAEALA